MAENVVTHMLAAWLTAGFVFDVINRWRARDSVRIKRMAKKAGVTPLQIQSALDSAMAEFQMRMEGMQKS